MSEQRNNAPRIAQSRPSDWTGGAWLLPGFGVFQGAAGDNAPHAHGAHQIVIGKRGMVEVGLAQHSVRAQGVVIPANMPHCVAASDVLLIYLDPLTLEGRTLFGEVSTMEKALPASLCDRLLDAAQTCQSADMLRQSLRTTLGLPSAATLDARLTTVVAALETSLAADADIDRTALANMTQLSRSRFSHWFVEHTGLPLRSYRKWLRLVVVLERVAQGCNLTDAAHAAGFADSAHMSRTFRQMFGINPMAVLRHIELHAGTETASTA